MKQARRNEHRSSPSGAASRSGFRRLAWPVLGLLAIASLLLVARLAGLLDALDRAPHAAAELAAERPDAGPETRPAPPPEANPGVPPAALPALDVRLIGTIVRPDPSRSIAIVERTSGGDARLVGHGEAVPGHPEAIVVRIESGFVDVDRRGELTRLALTGNLDPLARAWVEAVHDTPPRAPSEQERERRRALARQLRERMDAGASAAPRVRGTGLFEDGSALPVFDGDDLVAVELSDLEPGGLYDELGFSSGDRVTAVNGIPIGREDAAASFLQELTVSQKLEVQVEHADGSEGAIPIPVDELLDLLHERSPQEILQEFGIAAPDAP